MTAESTAKRPVATQPSRSTGRPKASELAELEARLLLVGREQFFEHGYGGATMHAVAIAAKVSKTTLYSRYPTKEALFRAIVADQVESWGEGPNSVRLPDDLSVEAFLLAYGDIALRAGMSPEFLKLNRLLHGEAERFPELAAIAEARLWKGIDYVAGKLRIMSERDAAPCRNPEAVAELFLMTLFGWSTVAGKRAISDAERTAWLSNTVKVFVEGRAGW